MYSRRRVRRASCMAACSVSPGSAAPWPAVQPACAASTCPSSRQNDVQRTICSTSFSSCAINAISRRSLIHSGLFGAFFTSSAYSTVFQAGASTPRLRSCSTAACRAPSHSSPAASSSSTDKPPAPTAFPRGMFASTRKNKSNVSCSSNTHTPPSSVRSVVCCCPKCCSQA